MVYTSLDNKTIKDIRKLTLKKYRDKENLFLVEGEHLVLEAYKKGYLVDLILEENKVFPLDVNTYYVTKNILSNLSLMDSTPLVMGVVRKIVPSDNLGNRILILDGIQDPGNLGTIIRSSLAFNIDTIILTEDSVDLYNPKVLRATQGMIFNINIVVMTIDEVINYLKKTDITIYGTDVTGGVESDSLNQDEKKNFILIMGNEGSGVRREVSTLVDKNLYIPMNKKVESLNVGVATSILLYEMGR